MRLLAHALLGVGLLATSPLLSQPLSFGQIEGPAVVMLNQERLFSESLFGQRLQAEIDAATSALARENRQIEAALLEEELQLTAQRAEMTAEEFRPLGDEFDTRVEAIRAEQSERLRRLTAQADAARRFFIQTTTPILVALLRERGAAAVLDSRAVIYSVDGIDITDLALQRIDSELGDGGEGQLLDRLGPGAPDAP